MTVPLVAAAGARPDQIGILVPNLETALPAYGTGAAWHIWTYGPETVSTVRFRGREGRFRMRVALSSTEPQIELIEPLDGPSIYHEWVERHGHGLHHLGFLVRDVKRAVADMQTAGFGLLQAGFGVGADASGAFAYFDTAVSLGFITEAIERPTARRAPERSWPPE